MIFVVSHNERFKMNMIGEYIDGSVPVSGQVSLHIKLEGNRQLDM